MKTGMWFSIFIAYLSYMRNELQDLLSGCKKALEIYRKIARKVKEESTRQNIEKLEDRIF